MLSCLRWWRRHECIYSAIWILRYSSKRRRNYNISLYLWLSTNSFKATIRFEYQYKITGERRIMEFQTSVKPPEFSLFLAADLTYGEVSDNSCVTNGYLKNRPLPSSKDHHFQNEAKCTTSLVKMSFICVRMKYHFISKAVHLTSFWYRGPGELGNGPFVLKTRLIFVRKARIVSQM